MCINAGVEVILRLVASCVGLFLVHLFSHVVASFCITFVCFYQGFHPEWSPATFREWKKPRESVLACLLLCPMACWLCYYIWASYLPNSSTTSAPTSHQQRDKIEYTPAIPTQAAQTPYSPSTKIPLQTPTDAEKTRGRSKAGIRDISASPRLSFCSSPVLPPSTDPSLRSSSVPSSHQLQAPVNWSRSSPSLLNSPIIQDQNNPLEAGAADNEPRLKCLFGEDRGPSPPQLRSGHRQLPHANPDNINLQHSSTLERQIAGKGGLTLAKSQEESPEGPVQDCSQMRKQPEEQSTVQDPIKGQATPDGESATTSDVPLDSTLSPEQDDLADSKSTPKKLIPTVSSAGEGLSPISQQDHPTDTLDALKTQTPPKNQNLAKTPDLRLSPLRHSKLPIRNTSPSPPTRLSKNLRDSSSAKEKSPLRLSQGKHQETRSWPATPHPSDSSHKPIHTPLGKSSIQATKEPRVHGEGARSVESKPGTSASNQPPVSTDDEGLDAISMISRLEDEFPNVRDYTMVEVTAPRSEMNQRWDDLEIYCKDQHTVRQVVSEYTLYNSLEYYELNRLTLWVGGNMHMYRQTKFPPDYPKRHK